MAQINNELHISKDEHFNMPIDFTAITYFIPQEIRRRFPNPPGVPYKDHKWSADA
jgi:hypothetical protein